jgi:hypothetical protein
MDVSLLRFALICLMVCAALGAVFILVLPMVMLSSMIGGVVVAAKASEDDTEGGKS